MRVPLAAAAAVVELEIPVHRRFAGLAHAGQRQTSVSDVALSVRQGGAQSAAARWACRAKHERSGQSRAYARHSMAASPHCAVEFVEMPGASSTGFNTAGASMRFEVNCWSRAVAAAALGEFLPGACRERGVLLAMRRVGGEARMSLLQIDAAEALRPAPPSAVRRCRCTARSRAATRARIPARPAAR